MLFFHVAVFINMANMRIYVMSARMVRWIMMPYHLHPPLVAILFLHDNIELNLSCHVIY